MTLELTPQDRDAAAEILRRHVGGTRLRKILDEVAGGGRSAKSVEWIVAETENAGAKLRSRIPDDSLAQFLVDLTGVELLSVRGLRLALAEGATQEERQRLQGYDSGPASVGPPAAAAKAIAARSWHAGKTWPSFFCHVMGFPPAFAGLAGLSEPPSYEEVEPFRPLPDLEDFQEDLARQVLAIMEAEPGRNRAILNLPTGAGKTRTTVEAILRARAQGHSPPGVLWIAQSDELCEQAVEAFREVWIDRGHKISEVHRPITIHRLWGARDEIPIPPDIVVATIQKLESITRQHASNERREALLMMRDGLGAIVVDEAHRMLAESYSRVLEFLGIDLLPNGKSKRPLLGLTATPYRKDDAETRKLSGRFHGRLLQPANLGQDPLQTLRKRGVLATPTHKVLRHDGRAVDLEDTPKFRTHFQQYGDFHPEFLKQLGEERDQALLTALLDLPPEWPVLFFGCSVEHAQAFSLLLARRGRHAAAVTGETRTSTRRFLVEEFRQGRLSVLCNYGVLTTGFDAPRVQAVLVARPTTSPVLYAQMIGRGMRGPKFGGTKDCLVIDVVDNIHFPGRMAFQSFDYYWARTPAR